MTDSDDTNESDADTQRDAQPNQIHQQWWAQNILPILATIAKSDRRSQEQALNQALVGVQGEALFHDTMLAQCTLSNVQYHEGDPLLDVRGKQQQPQRIRLKKSAHHLNHWLNIRPTLDCQDPPLWISPDRRERFTGHQIVDRFRRIGRDSSIDDELTPYGIRKDCLTAILENTTDTTHEGGSDADDSK